MTYGAEYEEEEYDGEGSSLHPDLERFIDMFNHVKEIKLDFDGYRSVLEIKLEDGTWSFCVFYDAGENPLNKEAHERLLKSLDYYLGEF